MTASTDPEILRLEGAPNFRDLGGHPGHDGRRVKRRHLFRSEGLAHLTARDHDQIRKLGIRLVCDLRSEHERGLHPSIWPADQAADHLHFDISADMRAANPVFRQILLDDPSEAGARRMMLHTYQTLPGAFAGHLREIFDHLLAGRLPVVVHCTAGKDRTGFLSAMLLSALGVPETSIYEDFLMTMKFIDQDRMAEAVGPVMEKLLGKPVERGVLAAINGVTEEYLDTALETVRASHGSVDAYLEQVGGLDARKRARLAALLLE